MIDSAAMSEQPKDFIAHARFVPGAEGDKVAAEGVKISRLKDDSGKPLRGQYQIDLPPGVGAHEIDIQLLGTDPRRYSLKEIDPQSHELRTFRYVDTPTMMEDTGFEMAVSVKTLGEEA